MSAFNNSIAALVLSSLTSFAFGQSECKSTATGDLRIEHFEGTILPGPHTLRVWLPPGYADSANAQRRYPVLYMLDGQNMFDVCPSMHHEEWQIDEVLTRLIGEGKIEPIIVVGLDAPDDGPLRAAELVPIPDPLVLIVFEPHGGSLPTFFINEVLPRIGTEYRVKSGRAFTGIGGSSYGAIAALKALITQPRVFGIGLIESPSLQVGNGEFVRMTQHMTLSPIRVSVGVGGNEAARYREPMRKAGLDPESFNRAFARNAKQLAENLKESGGPDIAVRFVEVPEAMHTEAAWQERFPADIAFLFPVTK
jgi:predicted alpha/beta superfamily hydrolase